ncbi:MAG: selenide, water dikinase SelD [Synergistes sp.]|nr:selenide, water dikinase SelD [Synergistes sp.]
MAKLEAGALEKLLEGLKTPFDKNLIVGYDKADDASVYKLRDDIAVINTVDFFPPVCDDPYMYGQIAAANSLSDVYAMGGKPKLALNIMCVCKEMDSFQISEILRGGYDKAMEAGCIITGGHTITAKEPVYGLSVTGFIHPDRIIKNSGAKKGDKLLLTKPLGTGIMMTADKADADLVSKEAMTPVYENMASLNKNASEIMAEFEVHGCTDITGFGFAGHAMEMARGSDCTIVIDSTLVPYYPEAISLAEMGIIPSGAYKNREYTTNEVEFAKDIPLALQDIMFDPQTSGGLFIAAPHADELQKALVENNVEAHVIGEVSEKIGVSLIVN